MENVTLAQEFDEKQILIQAREQYQKKIKERLPMPSPERLELLLSGKRYKAGKHPPAVVTDEIKAAQFDFACMTARQLFVKWETIQDIKITKPTKAIPIGTVTLLLEPVKTNHLNAEPYEHFLDMVMCADSMVIRVIKGALCLYFTFCDILVPERKERG
ncbi:MAG TPA: hypothetical protein PK854_11965 [Oscillospiraceae bacterium]|nr:hypothetical protein [Oscillospiraceae bacterium]HPS35968.1 hypothetical protein [Oscillospiraceae bacterium]